MLYPKSRERTLSKELFAHPTAEYRGTPFWAWNCKLERSELLRQIDILKNMGFGGFHMHARSGMETPYLSDEFMDHIEACVNRAKENGMLAWLYDEDRNPSGSVGGTLTKDIQHRMKLLYLSTKPQPQKNGDVADTLLCRYDVTLNEQGELASYRVLDKDEKASGRLLYAFLRVLAPSTWFNNSSYVDTLRKETMDAFIRITHDRYAARLGKHLGTTVPAIFTDEPTFCKARSQPIPLSTGTVELQLPFTADLPESFLKAYGEDLMAALPELVWELPNGAVSTVRYHYYDHVCERFVNAFSDNCGAWCQTKGIALTGHLLGERLLSSQTRASGEAMRHYRSFQLPGIDILCGNYEFTTAKQAQSAAHQYGREGVMSELYGVTGWDCDFRAHKLHGDWQAALGVTVRVPHLAWVSMKGEAKRDYPASINYQSPWHEKYSYIEDHFARINTAMTRGKPVVRIGVIHPIESYWIHSGPEDKTAFVRAELNENFEKITEWLLRGSLDFDFICESQLPALNNEEGAPLQVGEMLYDAVIVAACDTLRASTLARLESFVNAGGKLIFMGESPRFEDAIPSPRPAALRERALKIPFSRAALLGALEDMRTVSLCKTNGLLTDNVIYALREDVDCNWLFVAMAGEPKNKDIPEAQAVMLTVRGHYTAELYDTLTGEVSPLAVKHTENGTVIRRTLYPYDSLLLRLVPTEVLCTTDSLAAPKQSLSPLSVPARVDYQLDEPNALLLDIAAFALDDEPFGAAEELLRVDTSIRARLGYTPWGGSCCQPWYLPDNAPQHTVRLRFTFESEITVKNAYLASEIPDTGVILFDGNPVANTPIGFYVDCAIRTVSLPTVTTGCHTIELIYPYGTRSFVEWCYLLGDFGVRVAGSTKVITALPKKLTFGSIVSQGLPFYSGKLTYIMPIAMPENGRLRISVPQYRAAAVLTSLDGEEERQLSLSPYATCFDTDAGAHTVTLDLYISRTNGFGPVHLTDNKLSWPGHNAWRTKGDSFSYEYQLHEEGLLSAPQCALVNNKV